ncbi:hypothetical protein [Hydrogenophaga sp.]|uniref:hypothetical protein n=1 Tax=Hydrogenophaga sp. TaxID=1904254 RepID=UPI00271D8B90|nr:hypothetical protein [Hydrogenophaga sp.]MDO8906840.1 hypothetical protein [Hydrogenophaga sp.]
MKSEDLKTSLALVEEAELHSSDQLQRMLTLIDDVMKASAGHMTPTDCHRLAGAALDVNARIASRAAQLRKDLKTCETIERMHQVAASRAIK